MSFTKPLRGPSMAWPDGEPFEDHSRGTLKSGKEAEIFLVERRFARSGPRLLAHKRYRPRYPGKGELRGLGFSNSTRYRGDAIYKSGWNVNARDRRALESGNKSRYGHELNAQMWPMQEWAMLRRAWEAGASVPYPVERSEDGLMMTFIGDESEAAPKLAQARLSRTELEEAWRLVVIDLPQAVEFTTNTDAFDLLHRDVANVGDWFGRRGVAVDIEAVYGELVAMAWMG